MQNTKTLFFLNYERALVILFFVLFQYLPWEECNPDYGADIHCQELEFCYGQVCEDDRSSRPSAQFWRNYIVGRNGSGSIYESENIGYPKWDLLIGLYIGWLIVTLFTLKGSGFGRHNYEVSKYQFYNTKFKLAT